MPGAIVHSHTLSRTVLALARQKFISQHLCRAPGTSLVSDDAAESVISLFQCVYDTDYSRILDLDIHM